MAVTMADIARLAGVSVPTVGRVLNHKGYTSLDAKQRVEAAAKELGYVPNHMARALKSGKSGLIGSLVFGNENNVYQRINKYIMAAAEQRGYHIITLQTYGDIEEAVQELIGMHVDGLAIISISNVPTKLLDRLHDENIPVVAVERTYDHPYTDNLEVLDEAATYYATNRLISLGHRNIAMLCPDSAKSVELQRREGFQRALEESGVPREQQHMPQVNGYGVQQGKLATEQLLALPECPSAVLCASDILAAGAMQAFHAAGLRVPEDISVIGYDNTTAAYLSPPIDSVDLDLEPAGGMLFDLLERRMREPNRPSETGFISTTYVERGTTIEL